MLMANASLQIKAKHFHNFHNSLVMKSLALQCAGFLKICQRVSMLLALLL